MHQKLLVKKVISKISAKEVPSFDILELAKNYIKIPTKEEALGILKDVNSKKIEEALKLIPLLQNKKTASNVFMEKLLILTALIVFFGNAVYDEKADGSYLEKQIETQLLEKSIPIKKPNNLIKKEITLKKVKEIIKEKPIDYYENKINDHMLYLKVIEKNLRKQDLINYADLLKRDINYLNKKYQELSSLNDTSFEEASKILNFNMTKYIGTNWVGYLEDISKGKSLEDEDIYLVQKDKEKPENMNWEVKEKSDNW